ncbi:MAG: M14 family zinc carboxypeptidase [Gemmatimonadaceae bacterium]
MPTTRAFPSLLAAATLLAPLAPLAPLALVATPTAAQDAAPAQEFSFYDRGPYRTDVPRPETILGYRIGDFNTQYAAQERVLLAIAAAAPDRVRVEEFGSSYERRTMRLFIVSSPENIARLDAIRADLDALADPRTLSPDEADAIAARTPAVIWISYSVHGNESPGFEAAMTHLYQLAASDEPATLAALRDAIVILNPSSNPDGHERFAVWYNSIGVSHPDPGAMEHDEPWSIQGRYNHYRFDMNRDVLATSQREVQAIVRAMLRWHPMVAIDQHGMTEQYFFPPAASPVNENLGPLTNKWLDIIGRGNADAFDRYGWTYYVRDVFDLYYPGYWDVWPALTGATGMTYETDGGGWKGIRWERDDGTILTFRDGIVKHFVAGMATIETVAARRAERVADYVRFRRQAIEDGRTETMKRIVLIPDRDPGRAAELVAALLRAGIEVRRASTAFRSTSAHSYAGGDADSRRFDPGAYVVDLAQPQGKVARAILEPSPALDPAFADRQIERYRRNLRRGDRGVREGYEFYDVTAWSLPVTFGVDAWWTEDAGTVSGDLLSLPGEEPALPQALQPAGTGDEAGARGAGSGARSSGGELPSANFARGVITGAGARTAYVFSPERSGAPRLAYHLLREKFRVAVARFPIEAGGRSWPRGTYVVRVARNDSSLHSRIDELARESGVEVVGVNTAYTEEGQYGVGSEPIVSLEMPEVALVGGDGVGQTSYGAIWWGFERRYGIRFMPITLDYLSGGDLTDLDVIVIPDASAGVLRDRLDDSGVERLKRWVQNGGTLLTMGGSTAWAASSNVDLTSARRVGSEDDAAPDTAGVPAASPARDVAAEDQRVRARVPDKAFDDLIAVTSPTASNDDPVSLPGSHFDVELDRTHWLTFGYETPRMTVMMQGNDFYKLSREGTNVAVFPATGTLHRAGFIWPDNTERLLRGTALLIEESVGDGHVILFANEPMFRGWWRALDKLVLNAVVLGPAF